MSDNYCDREYQLPTSYNDNRMILIAQDPHWLYAYWEISDDNKKQFIDHFGMDLWEKSIPALKIINITKNEDTFIRVNEFSNSLYMNVADSNCLYIAEVGRRISDAFFVSLASSKYINTPRYAVSTNTATFFTNYNSLKTQSTIPNSERLYEEFDRSFHLNDLTGLSSPGISKASFQEDLVGLNSDAVSESKKQL